MGIRNLVWNDTGKLDETAKNAVTNFQKSQEIETDGYWGDYTTHRLNRSTEMYNMPDGGVFYSMPIRFSKPENVKVFNPKGNIKNYKNTFNGTFSSGQPISIMINDGKVIRGNSCHYVWNYPETVFYYTKQGELKTARVQTYTQIPNHKDIVWAIGGIGVEDYKPDLEGFCKFTKKNVFTNITETKNFSDVNRETWHSVFGIDSDGYVFGAIMYGTPLQIKKHCEENLNLTPKVIGDGGSWAACSTDDFSKNTSHIQYSAVQMG